MMMNTAIDFLSEARRLEGEGKPELAVEKYKQAIEAGGEGRGIAYQNLARLLFRLGRIDESVSTSQEALHFDPELPIAHGVLGTVHYMRREYAQAESELREATRLKPDYDSAWLNLA